MEKTFANASRAVLLFLHEEMAEDPVDNSQQESLDPKGGPAAKKSRQKVQGERLGKDNIVLQRPFLERRADKKSMQEKVGATLEFWLRTVRRRVDCRLLLTEKLNLLCFSLEMNNDWERISELMGKSIDWVINAWKRILKTEAMSSNETIPDYLLRLIREIKAKIEDESYTNPEIRLADKASEDGNSKEAVELRQKYKGDNVSKKETNVALEAAKGNERLD